MSEFAGGLRKPRGRKRKFVYRKYLYNGSQMNTFQMDLYEPPRIFSDQTYKYILVVIDVVTRFILTYPLKNKQCKVMSDGVTRAMLQVWKDIQKLRIDITTIAIILLREEGDYGQVFHSQKEAY